LIAAALPAGASSIGSKRLGHSSGEARSARAAAIAAPIAPHDMRSELDRRKHERAVRRADLEGAILAEHRRAARHRRAAQVLATISAAVVLAGLAFGAMYAR
jgi:hypothetical protein